MNKGFERRAKRRKELHSQDMSKFDQIVILAGGVAFFLTGIEALCFSLFMLINDMF